MKDLAVGRLLGVLVAVAGVGVAGWFGVESARLNAEFQQWFKDRPLDLTVDLSQAGVVTVPFRQTCSVAHSEMIGLEIEPPAETEEALSSLLKGLSGRIVISGPGQPEVTTAMLKGDTAFRFVGSSQVILTQLERFARGDYSATIRVDSGAPALAGRKQTLYARYMLCGLEQMPAFINGVIACAAGLIGFVAASFSLPALLKNGFWRFAAPASPKAAQFDDADWRRKV